MIAPGCTLTNGAVVVQYNEDTSTVLAVWSSSPHDPYVIWAVEADGTPYRGRYFSTLDAALATFAP